ncbi:hypothetical protein BH23ACT9_BH23ACT9_06400 [soil metagenome]
MALLLLTPVRRWLIAMLLLPITVWLLDRFTDAWCERSGDSFAIRRVRGVARWLSRYEAGPLAHHDDEDRRGRKR